MAAVDGALAKALTLRAQGEDDDANDLLQDLYAANPENADIEEALSDTSFGLGDHHRGADRGQDQPVGSGHRAE